ncbi:hypothetical protein [Haloplanus salilacus]|uniref:hypothetical protein n=1 Tax=Haloplanus salilacus TaxID=2949994 RepID=UPI0030D3411E
MQHRAVVAVLVLVALGAVAAGAPAAAQSGDGGSPTVSVDVGGVPLDEGEAYHTANDPWLRVTASADAPVSLVEVRVDGTTRHSFEPASESVDRSLPLDLATGDHRVTVVARADGVTVHEATVVKDDVDPRVTYDDPLEAAPLGDDPPTVTVENSTLTVAGTVDDASPIEYVRIDHAYEYERAASRDGDDDDGDFAYDIENQAPFSADEQLPVDTSHGDTSDDGDADDLERRDQYLVASPGTRFEESLTLALGTNYFRIVVEDAAGNTEAAHLAVTVTDDTRPTLNVTHIEYVSPTRLRISGWATDEVQVNDVWLQEYRNTSDEDELGETETEAEAERGSDADDDPDETQNVTVRHRLVFRQTTIPNRSRGNVSFDTTVYHPPGDDTVVIGVNDTARNDRVRNYSLSTFLAPTITVDDERTGYVDDDVAIGGRVVDGQIDDVSVEAVDPSTGRTVDIRSVELGRNGTFGTRLDGLADATRLRIRVRDVSGAEHVESVTVDAPAEAPATPSGSGSDGGDGTDGTGADDADTAAGDGPATFEIPVVGVEVPIPSVGVPAPLAASLSVPIPLVGPIDLPLAPVGLVVLALVAVAVRAR